MDKFLKLPILFLVFCICFSCQKEEAPPLQDEEIVYEQYGTPFQGIPETEEIIMYEVNLRAFSPGGNLQGVIDKLDHLESLGINVIWLMPIHPIGQVNSVNSPYSVKDYKAVATEYGNMDDLRKLSDEAHARGMAVMLDWVANHTAWDHPWIESNKSWYTQDASGNIVHPPGTNWLDVADLNFSNRDMRKAMIDAMKYWVLEANIDGYRCDYADGVPFDFWREAWQTLDSIPDRQLIYFAEGTRMNHFTAGFHLNFSWNFYGAIKGVFEGDPVNRIFTAHTNEYANTPEGKHWLRFTTNHDESAWDATPVRIFGGIDGALAASVLTVFTGGVPLIYSSQEVGRENNLPFFSNSFINWDANPDMLASYQNIMQVYNQSLAAKSKQNEVFPHQDIACFKKVAPSEELLIIANVRESEKDFLVPEVLRASNWKNKLTQEDFNLPESLNLGAYQFYILEKQ